MQYFFQPFMHVAAELQLSSLPHPKIATQLEQHFGSPSMSWVSNIKSSRLWLDVWLAGLCVFAFFIALVYRAFEASSSLTHELAGSL